MQTLLEVVEDCSALPGLFEAEEAKKRCMALRFTFRIMLEHPLEPQQLRMVVMMMMLMMMMVMMMMMIKSKIKCTMICKTTC